MFKAACALLLAPICSASPSESDLDTLSALCESNHWFALRDAVPHALPQPVFYRAAVACAFNDSKRCEQDLRLFFKIGQKEGFPDAHNFLVALYMRTGRLRLALKHRE